MNQTNLRHNRDPKRNSEGFEVVDRLLWAKRALNGNSKVSVAEILDNKIIVNPQSNYADQIYTVLNQAIVEGKLLPGTSITESALVEVFNISRTPIRSALQRLVLEDLVWIFPQSVSVVAPVLRRKIIEGIFVRSALEAANLATLVDIISDQQCLDIEHILHQQKKAVVAGDYAQFTIYDDLFHALLFDCTGRQYVWEHIKGIKKHLDRSRWLLVAEVPKHTQLAYDEHFDIYTQLRKRDRAAILSSMEIHINSVAQHLNKFPKSVLEKFIID